MANVLFAQKLHTLHKWMNEWTNWIELAPYFSHVNTPSTPPYVCLSASACLLACLSLCMRMHVHTCAQCVCECLCVLRDLFNVSRTSSNYFLFYILHSYHGIVHRYKCYQLSDRAFTLYSASNLHSSAHSNNLKRAMISSTLMLSPISTNLNAFVAFLHKCILLTIS